MKKFVWVPVLAIVVFGSATISSKAQFGPLGVRAHVPFDFIVGDTLMQAGTIMTRGTDDEYTANALSITDVSSKQNVRRVGQKLLDTTPSRDAKLVFRKYGDRYYLAEVWVPGYKAWAVEKSESERAIERESRFARNRRARVVTVVAEVR